MIKNNNLYWEKYPYWRGDLASCWQALLFDPNNKTNLLCSFCIIGKEEFLYTRSIILWTVNDFYNVLSKVFKDDAEFFTLEEAKDYVDECVEKTFKLLIFI